MEDVLEVYCRPHDPTRPVVCLDECSRQLIGEVRAPLPPRPAQDDHPGRAERYDGEYVRNGTATLFLAFEPLGGRHEVAVTDQRRRGNWACFVRNLMDGPYKDVDRVVLVMDPLNTPSPTSLYETRRSRQRRPSASPTGWTSTTRPSTAHGSIGPRSNSARSAATCRTGSATRSCWSGT